MSSASGVINHVTVVGSGLMGSGIAQVMLKMHKVQSPKRHTSIGFHKIIGCSSKWSQCHTRRFGFNVDWESKEEYWEKSGACCKKTV